MEQVRISLYTQFAPPVVRCSIDKVEELDQPIERTLRLLRTRIARQADHRCRGAPASFPRFIHLIPPGAIVMKLAQSIINFHLVSQDLLPHAARFF